MTTGAVVWVEGVNPEVWLVNSRARRPEFIASTSTWLIVSARSGFNLESTGLVTGKKTILSAIPLPSLSMGIGGGRRCDCDLG